LPALWWERLPQWFCYGAVFPQARGAMSGIWNCRRPDSATQEAARTAAATIVARLRSAFPNLARIDA
jgi:hypothetical protein